MKTVIVPADVPLPPNWAAARTCDGDVYYFHKVTKETRWEPPVESVADTTSNCEDSVFAWTAQEKEFKEKICSIIKKRFEPHRAKFKPDPDDYKQFIRKLLSKVVEKERRRSTDLKVTDTVALSTRKYVDRWVKILQYAEQKRASSRSDETTASPRKKSESPAGPE